MTNKCKTLKSLKALFVGSVIVFVIALVTLMVLVVYSLFDYPDSFFTTSHNFVALETAAPALHNCTMISISVSFVAAGIAVVTRSVKDYIIKK